jgi:LPXTG-site transpeptidase (sortase) family protein
MRALNNKWIVFLGLLLAITGVVRAAPDLAQAFMVDEPEPPLVIIQAPLRSSTQPDRTQTEVVLESLEGPSPSFSAKGPAQLSETDVEPYNETETSDSLPINVDVLNDLEEGLLEKPLQYRELPGEEPIRLVIPAIELDAPVIPAQMGLVTIKGREYIQWLAPDSAAAGWHTDTALLGQSGNTVINGHHNAFGQVFVRLVDLQIGDIIEIYSETRAYRYVISNKMILPEKYAELNDRMENARWILSSNDERITLITCWPYESNTHRLFVVASPLR